MGKRSSAKAPVALPPIVSAPDRFQKDKDAEELDLEERLFGTKKRRIGESSQHAASGPGAGPREAEMDVDDGELFMIDAPTVDVDGSDVEYEAESDVSVDEDEDEDVEVDGQPRTGSRTIEGSGSDDEID